MTLRKLLSLLSLALRCEDTETAMVLYTVMIESEE
jgi:hypothetical protein